MWDHSISKSAKGWAPWIRPSRESGRSFTIWCSRNSTGGVTHAWDYMWEAARATRGLSVPSLLQIPEEGIMQFLWDLCPHGAEHVDQNLWDLLNNIARGFWCLSEGSLSGSGFWERTVSGDLENSHQNPPSSLARYAIWGKTAQFLKIMRLWRMPRLIQKGALRSKWANSWETSGLKSNPKHRANLKDY